jgi:hypothetical protein
VALCTLVGGLPQGGRSERQEEAEGARERREGEHVRLGDFDPDEELPAELEADLPKKLQWKRTRKRTNKTGR